MAAIRFDSNSWLSGAVLFGNGGFGVLASQVPSSGVNGPGYLYNDLSLPADANKQVCGRLLSLPSSGTLNTNEDSSFSLTGVTNGTYHATYQLYVDGVATGSPATITFIIGSMSRGYMKYLLVESNTYS